MSALNYIITCIKLWHCMYYIILCGRLCECRPKRARGRPRWWGSSALRWTPTQLNPTQPNPTQLPSQRVSWQPLRPPPNPANLCESPPTSLQTPAILWPNLVESERGVWNGRSGADGADGTASLWQERLLQRLAAEAAADCCRGGQRGCGCRSQRGF